MNFSKNIRHIFALLLPFVWLYSAYSQAEFPKAIKNYIKINESAKLIKDAKISRSIEVLNIEGREDTVKIIYYDPDGYILSEISKTDTSVSGTGAYITQKFYYVYNNFKLLTDKFDSTFSQPKRYQLKYDEFYNLTDEDMYISSKLVQRNSFEYDDLSRMIEGEIKDLVNDCKIKYIYDYDSYNNLVKIIENNKCITGSGKPLETKYIYTYDKDYRILEKKTIVTNGEVKTETFTYTPDGKPATSYELTGTDTYTNKKYIYDKNTVRIQKSDVKGELSSSSEILIEYDKLGNRINEQYFDKEGKLLYTYKFNYSYY